MDWVITPNARCLLPFVVILDGFCCSDMLEIHNNHFSCRTWEHTTKL